MVHHSVHHAPCTRGNPDQVIRRHPALVFLHAGASDFTERYAETVVLRLFFALDPRRAGRVPASRLARCRPLLAALRALDGAAALDINEARPFLLPLLPLPLY